MKNDKTMINIAAMRKVVEAATGYDGYTVDEDGNVWSSSNWRGYGKRKLTPHPNSHGYLTVKVRADGRYKKAFVHIMVCRAFHGQKPSANHEARHLDGNKQNCSASNMAWGTRRENAQDRERHGRTATGIRNGAAVMTDELVVIARRKISKGETQRKVAADLGVSQRTIGHIARGERWTHVN